MAALFVKNEANHVFLAKCKHLLPKKKELHYDRAILKDTDTIHLRLLLSPGMESHSFEPAPSDILAIQNADLFLYNGGHMEEWVSQ
ncbi:MAG: zinc ABC transporter substrate-binding protein, partial [Clostridiales bacterium]|nr:zinc ABC transporter substrate-binding protein [Clostridiales bacterium]